MRASNSHGNTDRDVRRFLREHGVKPSIENVERVSREVRRTESQNEAVERIHREIEATKGVPSTVDLRGRDVKSAAKGAVQRRLAERDRRR